MKIHSLLAVAAVSILAASCTAGTSGIFASIEREQKVVSLGGLSKTATVTSMAELANPAYTHQYFETGGQNLFSRAVSAVTWNKSTVGGNTQVNAVGSVGVVGSETVFAVAGGQLYKTVDGSNWNAVSLPGSSDVAYDLVPIRLGNGYLNKELLLVTQQNDSYVNSNSENLDNVNVYKISTAGVVSAALNIQTSVAATFTNPSYPFHGLSAPVLSCIDTGSTYYFASESYIWNSDLSSTVSLVSSVGAAPNSGYQGLLYVNSTLYLSTKSNAGTGGGLYSVPSPSGTTLSFSSITTGVNINNKPVWFTQFLFNTAFSSIWVATSSTTLTEGTGYMELTGTSLATTPNNTDSNNYNSTVLPTSAVGVLYADHETPTNYFLGTDSEGLWLWNGTTTSPPTWAQQ